ncbi:hypothetical protein HK101_009820 [Irineochytrium annulatum]|nr:hypothetical protein HK101_009820 [Irineochytrium annulatum]
MFEGKKKKRKAKKVYEDEAAAPDDVASTSVLAVAEEVAPTPEASQSHDAAPVTTVIREAAATDAVLDFGERKKKKKAVKLQDNDDAVPRVSTESSASAAAPALTEAASLTAGEPAFNFGERKKRKGKGKRPNLDDFEAQLRSDGGGVPNGGGQDGNDGDGCNASEDPWFGSNREYTYKELLTRVFNILKQNNPSLAGEVSKFKLVPPQVYRDGTKKVVFANVLEISKRMRREPDHVIQYLFAELGTSGSVDGNQRLVIKGRFQPKQIESVLRRYIRE